MTQEKKWVAILFYLVLFLIIVAALYIRIYNLGERSLWLDEAWVANAIVQADLSLLVKKSLTAPLFFVLSIHYLTLILGKTEFVLRLLPCLFGMGALVVFYLLIRRITGKTATLVTLLMLSFSSPFIHYSKELKQYTGAMFFTLLLVYFCEKILRSNKKRNWIFFSLFCVLGVGFDHSILFIIPAVFLVLLIDLPFKPNWKKIVSSGAFVSVFSILFLCFHILKQISNSINSIQSYWVNYYPKLSSIASFLNWFATSFKRVFYYSGLPFFPFSFVVVILGLSLFYTKSKKRYLVYIILPLVLTLAASFLRRYPFGGSRLMLFYGPLAFLAFGYGLDFLFEKFSRSKLVLLLIGAVIMLSLSPVSSFVHRIKHPARTEETRPLLNEMMKHIKPTDKIYVYYGAKQAFEFYYRTKFYEMIETRNIIWGNNHRGHTPQYSSDLDRYLRKDMRIWIIFSHYWEREKVSIIDFLKKRGVLLREIHRKGTLAYLFKIQ